VRIAIANDLPLAVEALRRVVTSLPGYRTAWVARDGAEAIRNCSVDTPDLILMDLLMPVVNGVEATRQIMARNPCAILVVTATVEGNSAKVIEALGAGALDAVQTPALTPNADSRSALALRSKIVAICRLVTEDRGNGRASLATQKSRAAVQAQDCLIVIGASAGGPSALASILGTLPRDLPAAVVIVQHIDSQFAPMMASWLGEQSALTVRIAREHDRVNPGTALIAATNDHLVFLDSSTIGYTPEPRHCHYRPSIDVFFQSVANHWKGHALGVLLTGMGYDGAKGLKSLRDAGAFTIAQDSESCVVYGMPKAALELGAAVEILPIHRIAPRLMQSLKF
jgi:two-component system, chemotaxis family, response regulator WspF